MNFTKCKHDKILEIYSMNIEEIKITNEDYVNFSTKYVSHLKKKKKKLKCQIRTVEIKTRISRHRVMFKRMA